MVFLVSARKYLHLDKCSNQNHLNETGLDISLDECLITCQASQKLNVGRNSNDLVLFQSTSKDPQGLISVSPMCNKLRYHWVVKYTYLCPLCESLL